MGYRPLVDYLFITFSFRGLGSIIIGYCFSTFSPTFGRPFLRSPIGFVPENAAASAVLLLVSLFMQCSGSVIMHLISSFPQLWSTSPLTASSTPALHTSPSQRPATNNKPASSFFMAH
ncbi:hypothetical protein PTI98_003615 [Pleurotus ostreatus]|nr:hypothetical protein PTI98_003615 [Pleurotus ostreatus]